MARFDLGYVAMLSLLHKNVFFIFCVAIVLFIICMFPLQVISGIVVMILFLCNIKRGIATIIFSIIVVLTFGCAILWNGWIYNFYEVFRRENPLCCFFVIYTLVYFFLLIFERTIGRIGFWSCSPFLLLLGLLFLVPLYYFPSCPVILVVSGIITLSIYGNILSGANAKLIKKQIVLLFIFFIAVECTVGVIYSDDYVDRQSREMIDAYANYLSNEEHTYIVETEKEGFRSYEIKLRRKTDYLDIKQYSDTVFIGYFLVETSPFKIDVKKRGWGMNYLVRSIPYGKLFGSKKERKNN